MDKLKPCPFCGRNAKLVTDSNQYLVICTGTYCNAKQGWFSNESDAISAWNRRTLHNAETKFPDNNVEVLLLVNGCVIPGYYAGFSGSHHVWKSSREGYTFLDDEVTHWMPLPKSPKENEQYWNACVPMIEAASAVDNREKVIKALELCTSKVETRTQIPCETCPYYNREYHGILGDGCCNARSLQSDILTLLKAQEPVEPYLDFDGRDVWRCGNCHRNIFHPTCAEENKDEMNYRKYCFHCGRAVKWN